MGDINVQNIGGLVEHFNLLLYLLIALTGLNIFSNIFFYLLMRYGLPIGSDKTYDSDRSDRTGHDPHDVSKNNSVEDESSLVKNVQEGERRIQHTELDRNDNLTNSENGQATKPMNSSEILFKPRELHIVDNLYRKELLNDYYSVIKNNRYIEFFDKWNPINFGIINLSNRTGDSSIEAIFEIRLDISNADYWGFKITDNYNIILPTPRTLQYIESYYFTTGCGLYINGIYQVLEGNDFKIIDFTAIINKDERYFVDHVGRMSLTQM